MPKCNNCEVNTNYHTAETFTLFRNIPEHQELISKRNKRWREENCKSIFTHEKVYVERDEFIVLPYCQDCAKAIKKLEIERTGGIPLEHELEEVNKNINYHENGNYYQLERIENLLIEQNKKLECLSKLTEKIESLEAKFEEKLDINIEEN